MKLKSVLLILLIFSPAYSQNTLDQGVKTLTNSFKGKVSLYAKTSTPAKPTPSTPTSAFAPPVVS